ncbi:MAG: CPBP family intramembrane metalloprotease [Anaerolineales bacterium]|nr:CPBP family intramembrane metalloprotease [Anaerolineales bacterium]
MTVSKPTLPKPWNYFLPTLGFTWLFWITAALSGIAEPAPLPTALHYLGGSMPFMVTMVILFRQEGPSYRKEYWQRLFHLNRIPWNWLVLMILIPPLFALIAGGLVFGMGGSGFMVEPSFRAAPLSLLPFAVFMLLFGPLPEEMGWRGYALDWLQKKRSPLMAGLVLGTIWGLWHVPLFFIEGTYQHGLRGTPSLWYFFLGFIPQTIIMIWIFNNTRRSTLSAVLLHWSVNFTGELLALSSQAELFNILLWILAAVLVAMTRGAAAEDTGSESTAQA